VARCLALLVLGLPLAAAAGGQVEARGSIEYLFSPWDDGEAALQQVIREAREEILVQIYLFTSRPLARELIEASRRGVRVQVLADGHMHQRPAGSVLPRLVEAGIPVALESDYPAAHNKVMIVDADGAHPAVVTGSYNFTWSARRRNAENLLILRDNPPLAQAYAQNWRRHRRAARLVDGELRPRPAAVAPARH